MRKLLAIALITILTMLPFGAAMAESYAAQESGQDPGASVIAKHKKKKKGRKKTKHASHSRKSKRNPASKSRKKGKHGKKGAKHAKHSRKKSYQAD